uniref:ATP synthase F0 subunit 8 n=1 Tax=Kallima paralekta TaxID=191428 RepID=A0A7S9A297_9NEOP|nr:ATP synthase F0 subunit 8 [Kallima paralekta]QPF23474.1 ATP synthase F0 subunit 8 [Kallima paralekta]
MPQMMPINWIMSLFLFIFIFMMFISMNFFIFNYKLNNKFINKIKTPNNQIWKW